MAAEECNGGRSPSENPTSVDHSLDDLTREDMVTISRRRFLTGLGSTLALSSLATVGLTKLAGASHPCKTWSSTQSFQSMGSSYTFAHLSTLC
jgi:hypothetical protein